MTTDLWFIDNKMKFVQSEWRRDSPFREFAQLSSFTSKWLGDDRKWD